MQRTTEFRRGGWKHSWLLLAVVLAFVVATPAWGLVTRAAGDGPAPARPSGPVQSSDSAVVPTIPATTPTAAATPTAMPTPTAAAPARVLSVPWYHQEHRLSCEEASLRMALAYEGVATTETAILDLIPQDRRPAYRDDSGALRWGDPYAAFVGSPDGSEVEMTGYGTYYSTIAAAARRLGGRVTRAGEGIAPGELYAAVIGGHPVEAWVTYKWLAASRQDYTAFDGRRIPYAGPVEHAVVLAGIEGDELVVNDPDFGVTRVSRALFEARYLAYNQMAVILG